MSKRMPIKAARDVAKAYGKDQVILLCYSRDDGLTWVTTYGKTGEDCDQASQGGNWLKKNWLKWEDHIGEPNRVTKMKQEIKELKEKIKKMNDK